METTFYFLFFYFAYYLLKHNEILFIPTLLILPIEEGKLEDHWLLLQYIHGEGGYRNSNNTGQKLVKS